MEPEKELFKHLGSMEHLGTVVEFRMEFQYIIELVHIMRTLQKYDQILFKVFSTVGARIFSILGGPEVPQCWAKGPQRCG